MSSYSKLFSSGPTPTQFDSNPLSLGLKVWHSSDSDIVDIVFIHGLEGHREKTWTASNETTPWPFKILPSKIPKARLLTFGYQAVVTSRSPVSMASVLGHATNLLSALQHQRRGMGDRPIIFVCHSLGGLLCKQLLCYSNTISTKSEDMRKISQATRGIMFFGTPHAGTDVAERATLIRRCVSPVIRYGSQNLLHILKRDSELLESLTETFCHLIDNRAKDGLPEIQIHCFYESVPVHMVGFVVPMASAKFGSFYPKQINANHMNMVKFVDANDPGYCIFIESLDAWMHDISSEFSDLQEGLEKEQQRQRASLLLPSAQAYMKSLEPPRQTKPSTSKCRSDWLLQHADYTTWIKPEQHTLEESFLVVRGLPGSGKSFGLKIAADSLKAEASSTYPRIVLSHSFNACKESSSKLSTSPEGMYRNLLSEFVDQAKTFIADALIGWHNDHNDGYRWEFEDVQTEFESMIKAKMPKGSIIFIFIDAFDEIRADRDYPLITMLQDLKGLVRATNGSEKHLRVCISTRYPLNLDSRSIVVEDFNIEDIRHVVSQRLECIRSEDTRKEISRLVEEKASGCFLWVTLVLQDIEGTKLVLQEDLLEIVRRRPKELDALYDELLNPTDLSDIQRTRQCCKLLQLLLVAEEPLGLDEVKDALAIVRLKSAKDFEKWEDIEKSFVSEEIISDQVRGLTHGLVKLEHASEAVNGLDDESNAGLPSMMVPKTFNFMHLTVREYILKSSIGLRHDPQHRHQVEAHSHYTWLHLCMGVLSAEKPKEDRQPALLQYVYRFWMSHAREAEAFSGMKNYAYTSVVTQCTGNTKYIVRAYISTLHKSRTQIAMQVDGEEELLVCLASEGCAHLLERHLRECFGCKSQLDLPPGRSEILNRALQTACTHGRENVVKVLRKLGCDGNVIVAGSTPLYQACWFGHANIVEHLRFMGAKPDLEGCETYRGLPLHAAVACAHRHVIERLIKIFWTQRDWLLQLRNEAGDTALHLAAFLDRKDMATCLLYGAIDKRALAEMKSHDRTASEIAERHGHLEMVDLIREAISGPGGHRASF